MILYCGNMHSIPEPDRAKARLAILEAISENRALLLLGLLKNPEPTRETGQVDESKTLWHNWTYLFKA